jgi:hypothetical protein
MHDRGLDRLGMAQRQLQRDAATGAGADHHGGALAEGGQQRGGVVGLLGQRGLNPAGRAGAAGVAAAVVGGDGELVGEGGGHPGQLRGVAAGAGDQQHRRAAAAGLGVQDGAVGLHLLDVDEVGGLGHGDASPSIEQQDVALILGGRDCPVKIALQCVERS